MRKALNRILNKFGLHLFKIKDTKQPELGNSSELKILSDKDQARLKGEFGGGLKEILIKSGKTRWLDIGSGGNVENDFFYVDTFPEEIVKNKDRYFRLDIINSPENQLKKMGTFDLVRMQHVFEHFTPEDGRKVLCRAASLLNPDGYILITTPDLRKYADFYASGNIRHQFPWALTRIDKESPDSFYFSIFSHSMPFEAHHWCYDAEGLIYQLAQTNQYKNIQEVKLHDELANMPFTHNRPHEDVCVIAQLK